MADWEKAQTYSPSKESIIRSSEERNGPLFDNDTSTLEKERKRLDIALKEIEPSLCITEHRKQENVDLFILNTTEKVLFDKIEAYLKENENPLQYSLISHLMEVPHEKASYIPIKKYFFAIQRMPLSRKKNSLFLNILFLSAVSLLALYLGSLIYKIVQ